ncbi:DUF6221 family protein [Streptomyces sp900105755]|uniref:DUF6221 family protein n=1 Tax=Streptomyces sp. 900105755 TaxID=3154389 RepID=A0ABV1TJX2_9ACTN
MSRVASTGCTRPASRHRLVAGVRPANPPRSLRTLAQPYARHPGYRREWRPRWRGAADSGPGGRLSRSRRRGQRQPGRHATGTPGLPHACRSGPARGNLPASAVGARIPPHESERLDPHDRVTLSSAPCAWSVTGARRWLRFQRPCEELDLR